MIAFEHDEAPSSTLEGLARLQLEYDQEAAKRRRSDGLSQFVELRDCESRRLRELVNDPWVDHEALDAQKPPLRDGDMCKFLVVGTGLASMTFAARIINAGVAKSTDICFVDAAGGFGGAWYWNRFPGLHCDSESYVYLPLLEETGYIPKQKYSEGVEIREHLERIASLWGLTNRALFRTEVKRLVWDNVNSEWTAALQPNYGDNRQLTVRAKYVYLAAGALVHPQIPKLEGLEDFTGSMFHTARWDYSTSGGSQVDPRLDGLRGKRVAIIGTGCTAIQVLPSLAKFAEEVYVFQRTAPAVHPRGQKPTDPEVFKTKIAATTGWQLRRALNYHSHIDNSVKPGQEDLVDDAFTRECRSHMALLGSPGFVIPDPAVIELYVQFLLEIDIPDANKLRKRVEEIVKDPETAEKMKPIYAGFCKRPTFSDDYLQTFNLPHVHLVDTDGKGVSSATPSGLIANGKEYHLDVIILSTGYRAPGAGRGSPARKAGIEILGRNGLSFDDKWQSDGVATLHGMFSHDFPNLLGMSWANTGVSTNFSFMIDVSTRYLALALADAEVRVGVGAVIEATKEAEESWTRQCMLGAASYGWLSSCTPSLHNNQGEGANEQDQEVLRHLARYSPWSNGFESWMTVLEDWRKGGFKGLSISNFM